MTANSLGYANIARTLTAVGQQRATGELTLTNGRQDWKFYFFHGRLVYATGSLHRIRRCYRVVKQYYPNFAIKEFPVEEPWEYQLLSDGITHNRLSIDQAKAITQASLAEILFAIVSNSTLTSEWSQARKFSPANNAALSLLLSSPQVEQVLQQAQSLWKQWQEIGLGDISPNMAPVLKQSLHVEKSAGNLPASLTPFLKGQHTLWDISTQAKRPVTAVARYLLPWVQRGILTLKEVPDLLLPLTRQAMETLEQRSKPLIACVDDSPMVGKVLTDILVPAGYRVMSLQNPLVGIGELVKHKPDLIFLDLVMPDTSGYNLCNFLRRTLSFEQTPIIILTGQDSIIDRTRAKLVGASDFLSKPPDPNQVLNLVQHHLQETTGNSASPPFLTKAVNKSFLGNSPDSVMI